MNADLLLCCFILFCAKNLVSFIYCFSRFCEILEANHLHIILSKMLIDILFPISCSLAKLIMWTMAGKKSAKFWSLSCIL